IVVGAQHCRAPLGTDSIRTLALVHIHVLGVNDIAGLASLRATRAARGTARPGARACGAGLFSATRRLIRLVEHFGDLVQRALGIFRRRAKPRNSAFADSFLRVLDCLFGGLDVRFRNLFPVFPDHLLGLVENAVQTIARLDFLHPAAILLAVRLGFDPHLLGLFRVSAALI